MIPEDPDLALKGRGSAARDPTSWWRVAPSCREQRKRAVLDLAHSLRHSHPRSTSPASSA